MHITQALSTFPQPLSVEPLPAKAITELFTRLTGQLGAKVADLWAGVPPETVHAEWSAALAGMHTAEIERGLRACARRAFAPTLGEFVLLCRPALDPEVAWMEAQDGMRARDRGERGDWTHPAVFRAALALAYELRTGGFAQHRKRWAWTLAREFEKGFGDGVPEGVLRIEQQDVKGGPPDARGRAEIERILRSAGRR